MSSAVNVFVHACYSQVLTKSASHKKWYVLVCWDRFPRFNHDSVALVLLYNMRLEQNYSIERFQSYALLKISAAFRKSSIKLPYKTMHTISLEFLLSSYKAT